MTTNQDWNKTETPQGTQSTPWSCANGAGTLAGFQLSQGSWPDPLSNLVVLRPGPETQCSLLHCSVWCLNGYPCPGHFSLPRSQDANCHNPQACSSSLYFCSLTFSLKNWQEFALPCRDSIRVMGNQWRDAERRSVGKKGRGTGRQLQDTDLRDQLWAEGDMSLSGVIRHSEHDLMYPAEPTLLFQNCKVFTYPSHYFAAWIKGEKAPKYVQTGRNKCFRRETPESRGPGRRMRSLSGGPSKSPLLDKRAPAFTDSRPARPWSPAATSQRPPGISPLTTRPENLSVALLTLP